MYYYDWTMVFVIPGLLLGLYAQWKVKWAYRKYSSEMASSGQSAQTVARSLLNQGGCGRVAIHPTSGQLTDHYDPKSNSLALSDGVYNSSSIAAIGVAAHECGHAMQQQEGYLPLKMRSFLVPVTNIGSRLYLPIFAAGLLFSWEPLVLAGIACFGLTLLFSLITLPVEFNASRRAITLLRSGSYLDEKELKGAKAVLSAAALTYVASMVSSALQLLRLLVIAGSRRRDD